MGRMAGHVTAEGGRWNSHASRLRVIKRPILATDADKVQLIPGKCLPASARATASKVQQIFTSHQKRKTYKSAHFSSKTLIAWQELPIDKQCTVSTMHRHVISPSVSNCNKSPGGHVTRYL